MSEPVPECGDLLNQIGRVGSVMNEICIVEGLKFVALNNLVEFSSGDKGMVLGFTPSEVQVIIFGDYHNIKKGDLVKVIDDYLCVETGDELLGRIIDPLGNALDGRTKPDCGTSRYIDSPAKSIGERNTITKPLCTGYLIIDSQVPIGLGQRELFIGEKKVHKADVAMGIITNQANTDSGVISIYVAIDVESSTVKRKIEQLKEVDALKNNVIIVGRSSDPASVNYIAPMTAVTIAEFFANKGRDVLVIFDNLTSHAKVYRQISLLLNRAPGREAYPGDIFYLHARLLERCGAFSEISGNGSITAIPIVETQGTEDITDYLSTNLMSITDGHVLFRLSLSNKGIQPAVDSGFSVSRIGGRAQHPIMRELSDELKNIIIKFHEVEKYLIFDSEMKKETLDIIELGKRAYQFFYQTTNELFSTVEEIILQYFIVNNYVLEWEVENILEVRNQLIEFIRKPKNTDSLKEIMERKTVEEAREYIELLIEEFIDLPNTSRRIKKKKQSKAEKETIIDILKDREDSDVVNRDIKARH